MSLPINKYQSPSPLGQTEEPEKMSFYKMLQSLHQNGSFATREAWGDTKQLVFLDRVLKIRLPKNSYQSVDWVINKADMDAADWLVVL